jgi:O-antigen/teichoic acid export membrane protein
VRKLLAGSMAFAIVTTLPIILPILIVPGWIMRVFFGSEFTAGGPALFWLGIGQFALAASIPLNAMIVMGGDQKALGRQGLTILAVTFVVGWFVIPQYGALGAALVTTAANIALTIGMCALALPMVKWPPRPSEPGAADCRPEKAEAPK